MIKVLFVCLGNICRSPMAEAMFRDLVKREGLEHKIEVDSAGTGNWHVGSRPHHGTRSILKKYGVSDESILARQIKSDDLDTFNYIIAMDEDNIKEIKRVSSTASFGHVTRLLDLVPDGTVRNVPDPYYSGNFEEVYSLVKQGCEALLEKIKNENNLI